MTLRKWQILSTLWKLSSCKIRHWTIQMELLRHPSEWEFEYANVILKHDYRVFQMGGGVDAHKNTVYCAIAEGTDERRC